MGTTATTYTRKATFTVETIKGVRHFTAVNKRAHSVCKRIGKRSKITSTELKKLVGAGSYTFHVYDSKGTLKPIKF